MKGKYMNIELIELTFDDYNGYKYKPFEWCCEKLKDNPLIELTNEFTTDDYYINDNELIPSITIKHTELVRDWEDEWEEDTYYKINCCPFCGEVINITVISKEDVTEPYLKLSKERSDIWRKYCRTDSKRKSEKLRKDVYELDRKIDYFHDLLEYKNIEEI